MTRLRTLVLVAALVLSGSASAGTYTIQWGETLGGVARRLGVKVSDLAATNGISDPNFVRAGQVLKVPGSPPAAAPGSPAARPSGHTHLVRSGETLGRIAAKYGTTVTAIAEANGISDPNFVREGKLLAIPVTSSSGAAATLPAGSGACPVKGAGPWDIPNSYGTGRAGGRVHLGNDIFASRGAPVVANVSGLLRHVSGSRSGLAYYLIGDDGHTYFGAHLDRYLAAPGRVAAGQPIGTVGNTGNAATTPPHLHFEIKPHGGPPVDPHAALRAACRG